VQFSEIGLPDTCRVKEALLAWSTVMVPPEAVKGPTELGVEGSDKGRPDDGTGLGMAVLIVIVGEFSVAGVAPVASNVTVAEPVIDVLPRAAAASAIELGMSSCV
jgi:hypothetical protein